MASLATTGSTVQCSFGTAPGTLTASVANRTRAGTQVVGVIDTQGFVNVGSFAMCSSLANPAVASATSAASGVLTPQPCTPLVSAPWTPGAPRVTQSGVPVVGADSTCMCAYAGLITVTTPNQVRVSAG